MTDIEEEEEGRKEEENTNWNDITFWNILYW